MKHFKELAALKELRNNAGEELSKQLSTRNVADILVSAHEHDGKLLKKICIDYIIQNKLSIEQLYLKEKLVNTENGAKLIAEIYHHEVLQKNNSNLHYLKV